MTKENNIHSGKDNLFGLKNILYTRHILLQQKNRNEYQKQKNASKVSLEGSDSIYEVLS